MNQDQAPEKEMDKVAIKDLRPILKALREASVDMSPLELKQYSAQISGYIPGVGRMAVKARAKYRLLKLKAKIVRATAYRENCTRMSSAKAKLDADQSLLYMEALDLERKAQEESDELGSLHWDLKHTSEGIHDAVEAAKVDVRVSGQGDGP